MMSEDMMKYFTCHVEDEMKGATEYLDKMAEMKAAGMHDLAEGFYEMAEDEYSHAKYLIGEIMKSGGHLSPDHITAWDALEKRMAYSF